MGNVSKEANVTIKKINDTNNMNISGSIYGGGKGSESYPSYNKSNITINIEGGSYNDLEVFGGANKNGYITGNININIGHEKSTIINSVYGGGNFAKLTSGNTSAESTYQNNIILGKYAQIENVFNGGNNAPIGEEFKSKLDVTGAKITNLYGGGNKGDIEGSTLISIREDATIKTIHGGGKNGSVNGSTELTIESSNIENVYGGGENGEVQGSTKVTINSNSNIKENLYGAGEGKEATVKGNTEVYLENSILKNIYGGGKLGAVEGATQVKITSSIIEENAYGAGRGELGTNDENNGKFAAVKKSKIIVEGNTIIKGNLFGGGNAANVGNKGVLESDNQYIEGCDTEVYISGATIGTEENSGNVYGGSNRSKVWGNAKIYIGKSALDENYEKGNINIHGTVFGGGESRTDSTNFDYNFRSVHGNIEIYVDGNEYNLNTENPEELCIGGSIFGSGNASSASKDGKIYISNFGINDNIKKLKSIQRAESVIVDNSVLQLLGDTNSTNIHETTLYTLTNIGNLILKNNTTMYLENGAYSLKGFSSLKNNDEPAKVNIENGNLNIDGNNRIYMLNGEHLDITDVTEEKYGKVIGMTFFGQYKYDNSGKIYTGIYGDEFVNHNVEELKWNHRDFTQSYVLGQHTMGQNIKEIGFYTVYEDLSPEVNNLKEQGELNEENYVAEGYHIDYITPTPNDDQIAYDYWHTGFVTDIINVDVELTASKYSTLGVISKQLTGAEKYPNATLTLDSFSISNGLDEKKIKFVESDLINNIEEDVENIANKQFGLTIKTSNSGWISNSSTELLLDPERHRAQDEKGEDINYKFSEEKDFGYKGDNVYLTGSLPNSVAPSLEFYLFNSNTINLPTGEIGTYKLRMTLTCTTNNKYVIVPVIINIKISASDREENEGYNGVSAPGTKYDLFPQMATNITTTSSFSTYFELARKDEIDEEYKRAYRVLETGFAFPKGTTITMIDKSKEAPEYYYYTVTEPKDSFKLSDFKCMGTIDETKKYEDKAYFYKDTGYKYECFIFIVDFKKAGFAEKEGLITENNPRMEIKLKSSDEANPIYSLISSQQKDGKTVYNIYGAKSEISAKLRINNPSIYIGSTNILTVDTSLLTKANVSGDTLVNVYDTQYFDKKMGAEITVKDKNGDQISKLNGTTFQVEEIKEINGVKQKIYNTYTPYNGVIRLKLSDIFSNTSIPIIINTKNTTNDFAGEYTFEIKVFASADGIYGNEKNSEVATEKILFISNEYGLNATIPENQVIINQATSTTLDADGYLSNELKDLDINLEYKYSVANPYLTVSLARREYVNDDTADYSSKYISEGIDFAQYLMPEDGSTLKLVEDINDEENKIIEYEAVDTQTMLNADKDPNGKRIIQLNYQIKDNLPLTGTYRLKFTLYDIKEQQTPSEDTEATEESKYQYIGEVYSYIIIK